MNQGAGLGETHFRRRDPAVLPLHGETLGGQWASAGNHAGTCAHADRGSPCPSAPYLVGREQNGTQGEPRVVGDGGPLRRRLHREERRWRG